MKKKGKFYSRIQKHYCKSSHQKNERFLDHSIKKYWMVVIIPELKVCVLASTSKGNSTFISINGNKILLDAGISATQITKRLEDINENISQINGIIISHEHSDHTKGIQTLSKKYGLKFWLSFATYQKIHKKFNSVDAEFIEIGEDFWIENTCITPYEILHDAADPIAYLISSKQGDPLVGYLLDCGRTNPYLIDGFQNVKVLIIEANHSFDLLLRSEYPQFLKERILGINGHLSNWHAAEFIESTKPDIAILAHLSEENNSPEIALGEVEERLANGKKPFIVMVPYNNRSATIITRY